tara:strand:+ start:218 stop:727 length:510 start_codon:yes stop_codon:yes gene_type:complete
MNLGKIKYIYFFLLLFFNSVVLSEDKIISIPLVNLDELKPSYEESDKEEVIEENKISKLKEKKKNKKKTNLKLVNLMGLDKITAKTSLIDIKIGETKKFGLLEIKAIKCGNSNDEKKPGKVAYIQVKDLSDNQNEKIFIFNGWTFSSKPSLTPIDHPIYDIWLLGCENV